MTPTGTVNRYTLKEWLYHPTTIMLIVSINIIWILLFVVTDSAKNQSKECIEQVMYLRKRVDVLEQSQIEYIQIIIKKDKEIADLKGSL